MSLLHKKSVKQCIELGCTKHARSLSNKCIYHGGGKRCTELNCKNSARSPSDKCWKHGCGKRKNDSSLTNAKFIKTETFDI